MDVRADTCAARMTDGMQDDRVTFDSSTTGVSLCIGLINLIKAITAQQMVLDNICDAFKDINEHRLSKFEFAYLLVKLQEQMLDDDIQYNFCEHLYSGPAVKLTPMCDPLLHVPRDQVAIDSLKPPLPKPSLPDDQTEEEESKSADANAAPAPVSAPTEVPTVLLSWKLRGLLIVMFHLFIVLSLVGFDTVASIGFRAAFPAAANIASPPPPPSPSKRKVVAPHAPSEVITIPAWKLDQAAWSGGPRPCYSTAGVFLQRVLIPDLTQTKHMPTHAQSFFGRSRT
jgi:hypothetical protein